MSDDRRIGLQVPQYEDESFVSAGDLAYWEVVYDDGTVQRETDLKPYTSIDRARLKHFSVVHHGEILVTLTPHAEHGVTGHNLVWRRRTRIGQGVGRQVILLFGFAPMGPVYALDVDSMQYIVQEKFDPEDPTGVFHPPAPLEGEPAQMF